MTQDQWREKFRERLLSLLKESDMSQNQLAKESGLSSGRISDYINMRNTPTPFAIINIAYALDRNVSDLVDFDERITN